MEKNVFESWKSLKKTQKRVVYDKFEQATGLTENRLLVRINGTHEFSSEEFELFSKLVNNEVEILNKISQQRQQAQVGVA